MCSISQFRSFQCVLSFRVNHSNNAIVKPPELTPQAAAKELESVMKRVREAQSTIAAAIEPSMSNFHLCQGFSSKITDSCIILMLRLLLLLMQARRSGPPASLEGLAGRAPSPARECPGKGLVQNTGDTASLL